MPSRTKHVAAPARAALRQASSELLNHFVDGSMTADAIEEAMREFKRALIERALGAEMSSHLGYEPGQAKPAGVSDSRNVKSARTVLTGEGTLRIQTPRDREGSFEPKLIGKHERHFTDFDDRIIAKYAPGHDGARYSGSVD